MHSKTESKLLEVSEDALEELARQSELAFVDFENSLQNCYEIELDDREYPPPSAELHAGLSKLETFSSDQSDNMYVKKQHILKLTDKGKIEVIKDNESFRQPIHDPYVSANVCFSTLYPNGESAPTDCGEHTLARYLLKKQSQFAQKSVDGKRK